MLFTLKALLLVLILLSPIYVKASPHNLTGAWQGDIRGNNSELALWFSSGEDTKAINGILLWGDNCVIQVHGRQYSSTPTYGDQYNLKSRPQLILGNSGCHGKNYPGSGYDEFIISIKAKSEKLEVMIVSKQENVETILSKSFASLNLLKYIKNHASPAPTPTDLSQIKGMVYTSNNEKKDDQYKPFDLSSLDGVFIVNEKGISEIHETGVVRNKFPSSREVILYAVKSIYPNIKKGEIAGKGSWYPHARQFAISYYEKPIGVPACNKWSDESRFTFRFDPMMIKSKSGMDIEVYKETNQEVSVKPEPYCDHITINNRTCEIIRCNKWKHPQPTSFLLQNNEDALYIFESVFGSN